jgi:carbamoyl-phosphate synthase small subunit
MPQRIAATLTLEDGTAFGGTAFAEIDGREIPLTGAVRSRVGHTGSAALPASATGASSGIGELCFNTSMMGYQEILTDPSYAGQIVCFTTPHIGNVGICELDMESARPWVAGVIARDVTDVPCNYRSRESLAAFLSRYQVPLMVGVDTRALTQHLRDHGAQRGLISTRIAGAEALSALRASSPYGESDWVSAVSTPESYTWSEALAWGTPDRPAAHLAGLSADPVAQQVKHLIPPRVVVIDCGVKRNILRSLVSLGCVVTVMPHSASARDILSCKPHGIVLSNGPGDPERAPQVVATVKALLEARAAPILGICLGHQMLALALGAKTYKLKFGHRGGNHPVKDLRTGKVAMTAQNHGYAVDMDMLASITHAGAGVVVTHKNLNDGTCEGMTGLGFASVQYHPEAAPGPLDAHSIFTDFIETMNVQPKAVL